MSLPVPPFSPVFTRADKKRRTIMVPNVSHAFSETCAAAFRNLGFRSAALPMADGRAVELAKQYVHNDMCYPAHINTGEMLAWLEREKPAQSEVAIALAKNCRDCRAGQYAVVVRSALDAAGYQNVAIITTGEDAKKMHPGLRAGVRFQLFTLWGMAAIDLLQQMLLRTRPYEATPGDTDALYDRHLHLVLSALERSVAEYLKALRRAVLEWNEIPVQVTGRKPRCLVIGEILMNYHEGANQHLVRYLEKNGLEAILPDIVNFFWRDVVFQKNTARRRLVRWPLLNAVSAWVLSVVFRHVLKRVDASAKLFRYYEPHHDIEQLAANVDGMVDRTLMIGEGWLIPGEIIEYARQGVAAFIIIQPFGCLPNQITGRGLIKSLRERFGNIHILPVDFDADTSRANIENRLQMLITAARLQGKGKDGDSEDI